MTNMALSATTHVATEKYPRGGEKVDTSRERDDGADDHRERNCDEGSIPLMAK